MLIQNLLYCTHADSNTATPTRRAVMDFRVALIRSTSCSVCAVKYDSPQCRQMNMGMPSITSMSLPWPTSRLTSRCRTPGRPHDAQRLVDAIDGDDKDVSGPADFDDRFDFPAVEGVAADDTLDFASLAVALVRDDRASEDDAFEIDVGELGILKFFGGVDGQIIALQADQRAKLRNGRPRHSKTIPGRAYCRELASPRGSVSRAHFRRMHAEIHEDDNVAIR